MPTSQAPASRRGWSSPPGDRTCPPPRDQDPLPPASQGPPSWAVSTHSSQHSSVSARTNITAQAAHERYAPAVPAPRAHRPASSRASSISLGDEDELNISAVTGGQQTRSASYTSEPTAPVPPASPAPESDQGVEEEEREVSMSPPHVPTPPSSKTLSLEAVASSLHRISEFFLRRLYPLRARMRTMSILFPSRSNALSLLPRVLDGLNLWVM